MQFYPWFDSIAAYSVGSAQLPVWHILRTLDMKTAIHALDLSDQVLQPLPQQLFQGNRHAKL